MQIVHIKVDAQSTIERWRDAIESNEPADPLGSRALAMDLRRTAVRDAFLLFLMPGHEHRALALMAGQFDGIQNALTEIFQGDLKPNARVTRGRMLLDAAAHYAPDNLARSQAAAMGAVVAWWEGETATARRLVRVALAAHEGSRLAQLVLAALSIPLIPGWQQAQDK